MRVRRLILSALVLALSGVLSRAHVSASTLSLDAYTAQLDHLWSALDGASQDRAESLSVPLAPEWTVDLGSGQQALVDMRWLVQGLRDAPLAGSSWEQARERLRRRLESQRRHARELRGGEAAAAHGAFRGALARVLAEESFTRMAQPTLLQRIQRRIGAWLQSLFQRIGAPVASRTAAVIIAWLVGLTALVIFAVWVLRVVAHVAAPVSFGLAHEPGPLSAREWSGRWLAALARGDAREAVRCAYGAALRRLEEQGVWRVDGSRTPREYRRALGADDDRGPALAAVAEAFERAIYGSQRLTSDDLRRVGDGLERLGCLRPGERAI